MPLFNDLASHKVSQQFCVVIQVSGDRPQAAVAQRLLDRGCPAVIGDRGEELEQVVVCTRSQTQIEVDMH